MRYSTMPDPLEQRLPTASTGKSILDTMEDENRHTDLWLTRDCSKALEFLEYIEQPIRTDDEILGSFRARQARPGHAGRSSDRDPPFSGGRTVSLARVRL